MDEEEVGGREVHRQRFNTSLSKHSRYLFSPQRLLNYIDRIKRAKEKMGKKKTPMEYALLKKYDVLETGSEGRQLMVKKNKRDPYIRYVSSDQVFDIIEEAHSRTCHGGERRTHSELKRTVANVTREQVHLFLEYCTICEEKRQSRERKKRVVRPIVCSQYAERGQVDLIDMRSSPSEYNYILHYQDHYTKFSILRPLRSKQGEEVARHLYEIFTLTGAPKILQSDNGNEFTGAPLREMMRKYWPHTELVHGSPRYPQSQGSVERANGDVENMLRCVMRETNTKDWVDVLGTVQWTKNTVEHRVIKMCPYKAVFGQDPPVQMAASSSQIDNTSTTPPPPPFDECLAETPADTSAPDAILQVDDTPIAPDEVPGSSRDQIRDQIAVGTASQAVAMVTSSLNCLSNPQINDCVTIPIPRVDRLMKTTMSNIIGVVVDIERKEGHDLYDIATKFGRLRPLLSRNQFEMSRRRNLMGPEAINTNHFTSIREAAAAGAAKPSSVFCVCFSDFCRTRRCVCRRRGVFCTDRCRHGRNNRTGRIDPVVASTFQCTNKQT